MSGICAYIDILGFSFFVSQDSEGALKVLQNYQTQLHDFSQVPKDDEYTTPYRKDSFKYLIPFSDSIFFYSEKPSDFVMQLSSFINDSFAFTSSAFADPEDPNFPENVTEKGIVLEKGKPVSKDFSSKWYPLLFRGGIGFGDAKVMELNCIHDGVKTKTPFVFGKSVLEAVKLETLQFNDVNIKGPRIICTKEFYDQLNERAKRIVHPTFDVNGYYELNWTAVHYLMTDELNEWFVQQLLLNDFYLKQFIPAANLWKAYKNYEIEPHYRNFLKLIVVGVKHYLNEAGFDKMIEENIENAISDQELDELWQFLTI